MPGGDRTGPGGMGPMTGRGAGYCAGYDVPGYANPGPRRGFGMGRGGGWGRGWRRGFGGGMGWGRFGGAVPWGPAPWGAAPVPPPTAEQEAEDLRAQADWLKSQLDVISQRIKELGQE